MTTFTAVDGSTVTPITRADLMTHPAFADLGQDTDGNPCVWENCYADESGAYWSSNWSCQCDDDGFEPYASNWLPHCAQYNEDGTPDDDAYRLWESLPEAGSPEAQKAANDAAMAEHDAHVDRRETATILAALRFWQHETSVAERSDNEIATDGGELDPMNDEEIDRLCERINSEPLGF